MKKFLLALAVICMMVVPVLGQDEVVENEAGPDLFTLAGLNLNGDTLYLLSDKKVAVGLGIKLVSIYDDMFEVRAEYVDTLEGTIDDKVGLGVGVHIPKIMEKVGASWDAVNIDPTIGIIGLIDINNTEKYQAALYLSLVSMTF